MPKSLSLSSFPRTYPFKAQNKLLILYLLFFVGGSSILGIKALENNHPLILKLPFFKVFLNAREAKFFLVGLFFASLLFVIGSLVILFNNLRTKEFITLSEDGITCPQGIIFRRKYISISYDEVIALEITKVYGNCYLNIFHRSGKIQIPEVMLASKQILFEIHDILKTWIQAVESKRSYNS